MLELRRRLAKVMAISLVVLGAAWFLFEFYAQNVYLRAEFRHPQPEFGYIWATPMKGIYVYLSRAESLLVIYTPAAFGLFWAGAFWLERLRKSREGR